MLRSSSAREERENISLEPYRMNAAEVVRRIEAGDLSSEELVRSCLARVEELEGAVQTLYRSRSETFEKQVFLNSRKPGTWWR